MKRMNDTGQRKKQILQTAEKVFSENGYQQTSIDMIAKACGLVRGTVLHYFGSKDKLYQEVLSTRRNQTVDYLKTALSDEEKSVHEILQTALLLCRTQLTANSSLGRGYMENPSTRQSFIEMRIPVYEGLATLLEKLIDRGIRTGEIMVQNPKLRAQALAFAIFGITNAQSDSMRMCDEIQAVLEALLGLHFEKGESADE